MKETMYLKGKLKARRDSAESSAMGRFCLCVDRGLRVEPSGYSFQPTAHSLVLNSHRGD